MSIERRLEALEGIQDPARYRVFHEPLGMEWDAKEAWRANVNEQCERDGVTPVFVVREHDAPAD